MDDFQWGLLILGGIAVVGSLGLAYLVLTQPVSSQPVAMKNEESWEYTDWRGRRRTLTGHRKVEPVKGRVVKL